MTAEVIQITRQAPTWDDVRVEYGKMAQMGWQSVLQAAKVGAMLATLKEACANQKEFVSRAIQHAGIQHAQVFRLMRLATNMPLLEKSKPDSQRAALALIAEQKKAPPKPQPKVSWVTLVAEIGPPYKVLRGGNPERSAKAKLEEHIGQPIQLLFTSRDCAEAKAFVEMYKQVIGAPKDRADEHANQTRAELTASQQKKLDAATKAEWTRLNAQYRDQVASEVKRQTAEKLAHLETLEEEAKETTERNTARAATIIEYMTQDEFNMILNCLHPDRAPEERRERFAKAFAVVKRLETYVNYKLPLSVLRERGWSR